MSTIPESRPLPSYASVDARAGFVGRFLPTLAFYGRVTPIVFGAAAVAKRGRFDDEAWRRGSWRIVRAFETCGCPVSFENIGVLSRIDGPCVFVGNHMSTAETFMLAAFVLPYRRLTFVVKRGLVEYPIFKHIMRSRDPVVVGRESPKEDFRVVMEEGAARLKKGVSVVVFPQRTRSAEFVPEEFNTIGVKLARRAGVPIVPLALKTDAWANGKRFKDFGPFRPSEPCHFALGEPLPSGLSDREANEAVIAFIREKLTQWGHSHVRES